jgi:hypothetical protein
MVAFFVLAVIWPFITIVVIAPFKRILDIRGLAADGLGLLAWLASSAIPFLIGMKYHSRRDVGSYIPLGVCRK